MARPIKQGLDYYSTDVDMYADDKVKFISAIFELDGEAIMHRLLAHIYRNGFYTIWGEDETMLFAMSLPCRNKSIKELTGTVKDVVDELLKRDFFDKPLYDKYKILTSKGIQRRYFTGTEKRTCINIDERYWLLKNEKGYVRDTMHFYNIDSPENGVSSPDNSIKGGRSTQSKVKESKEDIKDIVGTDAPTQKTFEYDSIEYLSSKYLAEKILEKNPNAAKVPRDEKGILKWCIHIDRLLRIDKKAVDEFKRVLKYAASDPFWSGNILSTQKFREKYDTLFAHMQRSKDDTAPTKNSNAGKPSRFVNFKQRDWDYDKIEQQEREYIEKSLKEQ